MQGFQLLFAILLLGASLATAQQDSHLTVDPARLLYARSPWAHGYIHGYESGFHYGIVDYHMSHAARNLSKCKEARDTKKIFRVQFGDRRRFNDGFVNGFKVGYTDAYGGREFRAAREARELIRTMPAVIAADNSRLDEAIASGYGQGQRAGLEDGRRDSQFAPDRAHCTTFSESNEACAGFTMGYRLGYFDGYLNQRPANEIRTAMGDH